MSDTITAPPNYMELAKEAEAKLPAHIPREERTEHAETFAPPPPPDSAFTKGTYKCLKDGKKYALAVHEEDGYGNTHSLKNSSSLWQGDKQSFKENFEKI
jgi:hypothetical protein